MRPKQRETTWKLDGLFLLLLALSAAFLIPRMRIGANVLDEPFYFNTAHRLLQGDALLSEEWHLSQLSSVLMLPFLKLWLTRHTMEGVYLAFRYIYLAVKAVAAVGLYGLLRRRGQLPAMVAALILVLYAPFDLYQISYHSMGILAVTLHGALIVRTWERPRFPAGVVSGLFLAVGVLCCPYLLGLWLAELAGALLIRRKNGACLTLWLWITAGAAALAVVVIAFLLSRAAPGEMLRNFAEMRKDPEHSLGMSRNVYYTLLRGVRYFSFQLVLYAVTLPLYILWRGNKLPKVSHRTARCLYGASVGVGFAVSFVRRLTLIQSSYNYIMIPASLMGLMLAVWLLGEKNADGECLPEIVWWGIGFLYALAICASSNQQLHAFGNASTVSAVATAFLAVRFYAPEDTGEGAPRLRRGILLSMAALQLLGMAYRDKAHVFEYDKSPVSHTDGTAAFTALVQDGPLKGIRLTQAEYDQYNAIRRELDIFRSLPKDNFAMAVGNSWAYLDLDMPYGIYSGWSGEEISVTTLSEAYYALHPDKIPRYVYLLKDRFTQLDPLLERAEENGYTVTEMELGVALIKAE